MITTILDSQCSQSAVNSSFLSLNLVLMPMLNSRFPAQPISSEILDLNSRLSVLNPHPPMPMPAPYASVNININASASSSTHSNAGASAGAKSDDNFQNASAHANVNANANAQRRRVGRGYIQ